MNQSHGPGSCPECGTACSDGEACPNCGTFSATVVQATDQRPAPAEVKPPQIAIIGTEGSGKTVLITTLAKRFSEVSAEGVFLEPLDNKTLRYVERTWQTLGEKEWPESSPVGKLFELAWRLHCGGDSQVTCDVRLADCAGQDLRRLFADDDADRSERLPAHLERLAEYCQSADIVICLVNLRDFVGEADAARKIDNQAVIMSALRVLATDAARRLYLLFTQIDLYKAYREKYDGWPGVVKEFLPYVHGAHVARKRVMVGAVAAVDDTVPARDGAPRRVPAPGFKSRGLEGLMDNIAKDAAAIVAARRVENLQRQEREIQDQRERLRKESVREAQDDQRRKDSDRIVKLAISAMIAILLLFWWTSPPAAQSWSLPIPALVPEWGITYGIFYDDIWLRNNSKFTMRNVTLKVDINDDGQLVTRRLTWPVLPVQDTHTWKNEISVDQKSGASSRVALEFVPGNGSWGINYGRLWNEVWVRNDDPVAPATNVSLAVTVTTNGKLLNTVRLMTAELEPGRTYSQWLRVSSRDELSAALESWQQ